MIKYSTKIWKTGNSNVVTIKKDDMDANNLNEGDLVNVQIKKVEKND